MVQIPSGHLLQFIDIFTEEEAEFLACVLRHAFLDIAVCGIGPLRTGETDKLVQCGRLEIGIHAEPFELPPNKTLRSGWSMLHAADILG